MHKYKGERWISYAIYEPGFSVPIKHTIMVRHFHSNREIHIKQLANYHVKMLMINHSGLEYFSFPHTLITVMKYNKHLYISYHQLVTCANTAKVKE